MSEAATVKAQPPVTRLPGEVTIEIADACNRGVLFGPKKVRLRGRWNRDKFFGQTGHAALMQLPSVPGLHVSIDPQRKRARIYDPLTLPEHAATLRQVQACWKQLYHEAVKGEDERAYEDLSATDIKSWLTYMRRLVDNRTAEVVKGQLPTLKEIEQMPGKTRIEYWNTSYRARNRCREDQDEEMNRGTAV